MYHSWVYWEPVYSLSVLTDCLRGWTRASTSSPNCNVKRSNSFKNNTAPFYAIDLSWKKVKSYKYEILVHKKNNNLIRVPLEEHKSCQFLLCTKWTTVTIGIDSQSTVFGIWDIFGTVYVFTTWKWRWHGSHTASKEINI